MKILVTGGDGLLAYALNEAHSQSGELLILSRNDFDLTNPVQMRGQLAGLKPDVVINTAAYNLVDRCEIERDLSWSVNAAAPAELAELCARQDIRLIHYSTDYVFDGAKKHPYAETDAPNPLNHYAAGKLAGEQAVLRASPRHIVCRTSWVFGWHPTQAKTFIHTVLKAAREGRALKSTTDQASVPTFAGDLADWTLELAGRGASGLFHAVNDGGLSRFDWTKTILADAKEAGLIAAEPPVEAVTSAFFNSTMRRPDYTVMSNDRLAESLGHPMGSWRPGQKKMLARMK